MKPFINALAPWIFIGIAAFTQGCARVSTSPDDSQLTSVLNSFINEWHQDAAASDHAKYIGAMAEGGIYTGTDATEYWTTREFSKWSRPYFEKGRAWNLKPIQRHIYIGHDGLTAWFDELLDTSMGLCRGSGVLQKKGDKWEIFHYVLSPTIPNELTNEVKQLKSQQDSLLIEKIRNSP